MSFLFFLVLPSTFLVWFVHAVDFLSVFDCTLNICVLILILLGILRRRNRRITTRSYCALLPMMKCRLCGPCVYVARVLPIDVSTRARRRISPPSVNVNVAHLSINTYKLHNSKFPSSNHSTYLSLPLTSSFLPLNLFPFPLPSPLYPVLPLSLSLFPFLLSPPFPKIQLGGLGSDVSFPSGIWGRAPAEIELVHFKCSIWHLVIIILVKFLQNYIDSPVSIWQNIYP